MGSRELIALLAELRGSLVAFSKSRSYKAINLMRKVLRRQVGQDGLTHSLELLEQLINNSNQQVIITPGDRLGSTEKHDTTNLERSGRQDKTDASVFFDELLLSGDRQATAWRDFHFSLSERYDEFSKQLGNHLSGDELLHMLSLMLIAIARNGFKDEDTKNKLFDIAQSMGVHILPTHFYSPLPNTKELPKTVWEQRFPSVSDLVTDAESQLNLIDRLAKWASEMADTPADQHSYCDFYWNNPNLGYLDAVVYYSMIRGLKPKTIIEVGAGYSTMLAAKAVLKNTNTMIYCIDPYPMEALRKGFPGLKQLTVLPVQEVPLSMFDSLERNDILFVDSTHISKIGSDVNHIVLNILPRLKPGVFIHFHDIFLPWDYPKSWVLDKKIFYNEGYILSAFLLCNPSFKTVLANYFLVQEHSDHLRRVFPFLPKVRGGSLWIQRTE